MSVRLHDDHSWCAPLSDDAAKAEMAHRSIDGLRVTRCWAVATAVARRAQVRSALQNLAWDVDFRVAGIIALLRPPTSRVDRNAACFRRIARVPRRVEVARPLPDIANHV